MKISKGSILKGIGLIILVMAVAITGIRFYNKNISPTKIAFINFQEFQLARIDKSNSNDWIKIDVLEMDELDKARDYTAIFIFGRGFHMSSDQMETLENVGYSGVNLFVESATNPNVDVTNLKGEDLDFVTDYISYGGTSNYSSLLSYIRKNMEGKNWFVDEPQEPKPIPNDVFLHLDEDKVFADFQSYDEYLKDEGFVKEGQPKVALVTSVPGPFNANRDHIDAIISMLEGRGMNVYTISAATKRLQFLQEVDPDLVVLMPHGRLTLGQADEATAWLKEKNIPMLSPLSVFQPYEDWVDDPQGFAGPLLSMSVVLPEIDGGINSYAIVAQYEDEQGYLTFRAIPDRLEKFGNMVEKWLALKEKSNAEKKIAIYYFKGPGLNAMVAANMEVVPSIYNTLVTLKEEGYTVENFPASSDELWEMIKTQGAVLGPYAKGAFDEYLENGNPALVESSIYEQWAEKDLEADSYQALVEKYGSAPGEYLSTNIDGEDYIAVARLQFGNVVLLPQPLSGLGNDSFKIVHGTDMPPPHPYVASYLWTKNEFQADAVFHWGTHGSLEFTPGKQVALSGYDWTDALIGMTPHFYIYTISNVGEGIIAKRRSYATTLSYLTPPFMESEVSGDLKKLSDKLTAFVGAKGAVREQYRAGISQSVRDLEIYVDLGLDSVGVYDDDAIFKISNYVETVRNEKVTGGLYTMGTPYNSDQINNTARLMTLDPIAYSLASLDKLKGNITQDQLNNQVFFDQEYRSQSKRIINSIIQSGRSAEDVLSSVISRADLEIAHTWAIDHAEMSSSDIIRGFIGMARKDATDGKSGATSMESEEHSGEVSEQELADLKQLVIVVSPYPERKEFILSLKSDKRFQQSSGLLDPATLEKAKTIAKAIPAMQEAIEIGQQPDVLALLKMMQKEPLRQKTFELMEDESLAEQVALEKEKADQELLATLTNSRMVRALQLMEQPQAIGRMPKQALQHTSAALGIYARNEDFIREKKPDVLTEYLTDDFETELEETKTQVDLAILKYEQDEAEFAHAVIAIENAVRSVDEYRVSLAASTEAEMDAVLTGTGGGYIVPSSGGDPITNPATVPTGRNLYSIDAEKTPSPEAWKIGQGLAESLLEAHFEKHGEYPKKVSFTLWPGDFIETEGALIAEIFYLLGVEPVRDPFNRVVDIKLISESELGRPRIDVIAQTAGQFRDLAASRMYLINKAVKMAADANDAEENYVKKGVLAAEIYMKEQGLSPLQAREWSTQRVFGGVNGIYGTNIMGLVERGDRWENESEVAEIYLNNMGAIYDEGADWGAFQKGVFEAALQNTEAVVQPRESNTWGGLSLDHVYEFMGGLSLAVRHVTGNDPDAYFNDFRNHSNPKVQGAKEALWVEARSTLLNPKYIKEYMKGGATSAETFAETFRNTYGWNVMKPNEIDDELWDNLHDVYVKDELDLNVHEFFERENPYALEEMTAVMLETIRKGYWEATQEQIEDLTNLHTQLIKEHKPGCSEFVCNNQKLQDFISENLSEQQKVEYQAAIKKVLEPESAEDGVVLTKETLREAQGEQSIIENKGKVVFAIAGVLMIMAIFLITKRRKQN